MSIFSRILSKIFGGDHAEHPATSQSAPATTTSPATIQQPGAAAPAAARPPAPVDVEKILSEKAAASGQALNWQESIVDLLKLLDLDSSLQARRELADELGYKGDKDDTATMNMWLIDAVRKALRENGGRVPAALKD